MRASHIFIFLFLVVPIVEIYFLIQVGSIIGAIPTILLILATAIIGAFLLRQQGLSTLSRLQNNLAAGKLPAQELIEGVLLAVGGALLMTPGFVTDAIGFCCLIPFTRKAFVQYLIKHSTMRVQGNFTGFGGEGQSSSEDSNVYDGEFVRKRDERLDKE